MNHFTISINKLTKLSAKLALISLFLFTLNISSLTSTANAQGNKNYCEDSIFPSLVVCGRSKDSSCGPDSSKESCKLKHVFIIIPNIILFAITFALILIPIYIMYIGIQLIIYQGKAEQLTKLKKQIIASVGYLILIFGAWLIVKYTVEVFQVSSDVPSFLLDKNGNTIPNPGASIK